MERTCDHWRLFKSGAPRVRGAFSSPGLDVWDDLEERERALHIEPGRPFLLRPDFTPDVDVLRYFASARFRRLAPLSQLGYAHNLKVLLSYLDQQRVDWRVATEDDLLNYDHWRRRDPNNPDPALSGSAFARELAAFRHFFEWQKERGVIAISPVVLRATRRGDGRATVAARLRPSNVRSSDVKWLTEDAYRLWRSVGLAGYTKEGLPDPSWRGRNDGRNLAFADLLWESGLRRREAGTLLLQELPEIQRDILLPSGRIADAVAKGPGRKVWIAQPALQAIEGYRLSTRAESVRRAQAAGRYDTLRDRRIILRVTAQRQVDLLDEGGGRTRVPLDNLDADDRLRLFTEHNGTIEPATVWLTEAGMPMRYDSWNMVFRDASLRCAAHGVGVRCYPHMLRHSFALRWLVTITYIHDKRFNLTPEERAYYRKQFGDPFAIVQGLLGHRSKETTEQIYLAPARDIELEQLLRGRSGGVRAPRELMDWIVENSPQVQDVPS